MPTYHVSLNQFARILANLDTKIEAGIVRGLRSTALRLQGIVVNEIDATKPYAAVDRGSLRNSVETEMTEKGAVVQVTAPHAPILEYGTRPFFPPLEPIERWVWRKGLADPKPKRGRKKAEGEKPEPAAERPGKPKKPVDPNKPKKVKKPKVVRRTFEERTDEEVAEVRRIAFAIALKFSREGMKPRFYFKRAVERLDREGILAKEVNRELNKLARQK